MMSFADKFYKDSGTLRMTLNNQSETEIYNFNAFDNGNKCALIELARFHATSHNPDYLFNLNKIISFILSKNWTAEAHELYMEQFWEGDVEDFVGSILRCIEYIQSGETNNEAASSYNRF